MSKTNNTIQAFWVAIGSFSSFLLSIVSAAVLSRYLDKNDYGTYKQILYVYNTLLVIFMAGLPRVFSYFLPKYSLEEGKQIVLKITRLLFFSGLLFSLFLFLFSTIIANLLKNPGLADGLRIFSPIPMLLLPTLGIEGIFSTYKKTIYIALYNTISRLLMLIFIVVPVIMFGGGYTTAIYGWIAVSVMMLLLAYIFKNIPFRQVKNVKNISLKYKEIFAYSLPLVVASIWGIFIKSADQFYVSRYFGVKVFAEFSNGFIELPLVGMVTAATSTVLMPVFSKIIHDQSDISEVSRIWQSALSKSIRIIYPVVVFSIFCAVNIIELLYSKSYTDSTIYFQICMIINFFNIIIFAPLIFALNETRFYARLHCYIAIASWTGGYLVVLLFNSAVAIAVFSVFLSIVKIVIAFLFISKKINVSIGDLFPFKLAAKVIVHTCICIIVSLFIIKMININNVFLQLTLKFIIYYTLVFFTSKAFNINYLSVYLPLLNRFLKKQ